MELDSFTCKVIDALDTDCNGYIVKAEILRFIDF